MFPGITKMYVFSLTMFPGITKIYVFSLTMFPGITKIYVFSLTMFSGITNWTRYQVRLSTVWNRGCWWEKSCRSHYEQPQTCHCFENSQSFCVIATVQQIAPFLAVRLIAEVILATRVSTSELFCNLVLNAIGVITSLVTSGAWPMILDWCKRPYKSRIM